MDKKAVKEEANLTVTATAGCIVGAGLLLALLDGGIGRVIFTAIAGTSAYVVHNMSVNDIPADLKKAHPDECAAGDNTVLMAASVLSAASVIINPWVGIPMLIASILFHWWMQENRDKFLLAKAEELGLVNS